MTRRKINSSESIYKRAEKFLSSDTSTAQATKVVLALIATAGVLTAFAVAPGLGVVARQYKRMKYYSKRDVAGAVQNLKRGGYVKETRVNGVKGYELTEKGKKRFEKALFEEACIPATSKWDGKWRFVLFDVPVNHSNARDALRWRLKQLGFYQYQKSVWVYPYPCEKEILYLSDYYGIGKYLDVLEVNRLTDDSQIRKYFKF